MGNVCSKKDILEGEGINLGEQNLQRNNTASSTIINNAGQKEKEALNLEISQETEASFCFPSKKKNSSQVQDNNNGHKVRFLNALVTQDNLIQVVPKEHVLEMTVCKQGLNEHWYVRVYTGIEESEAYNIHYDKDSDITITQPTIKGLATHFSKTKRKTRYSPQGQPSLHQIVEKCLGIAKNRTFKQYKYSCHDFTTELMEGFTQRETFSFFGLPILSNFSINASNASRPVYFRAKYLTILEKEFLDECQKKNDVSAGIRYLEIVMNNKQEAIIIALESRESRWEDSLKELQEYATKVLKPYHDQSDQKRFAKFVEKQKKELKIDDYFSKAVRLAILAANLTVVPDFSDEDMTIFKKAVGEKIGGVVTVHSE